MLLRRLDQEKSFGSGPRRANWKIVGLVSTALFVTAVFFILPGLARAASVDLGLGYASATGLATTDIRTIVGNILKAFFALLGVVAVVLILYAGVLWMTSSGNEEKISQAKKILINATIGLIIMLAAYAITAFIFRALQGQGDAGGEEGGGGVGLAGISCPDCGPDGMGKILEYHYPEAGQAGVPRNTKIAITFKKPLVLSTVFKDYDDKGTYTTTDDVMCDPTRTDKVCDLTCSQADGNTDGCGALKHCSYNEDTSKCLLAPKLNTANFKIVPNESLGQVQNTPDKDADFNLRYPDNAVGILVSPDPYAAVTVVNATFDPNNKGQTIVIKPIDPIGSANNDVNYRVSLRGGAAGVKVWSAPPSGTEPQPENAFSALRPDGSYFWSFTTNTTLDTTPPQISFVGPRLAADPADKAIVRNQILQIYFDEAVDPATATGKTGSGGFNTINVEAKCAAGTDIESCPWNKSVFTPIEGSMDISNRYRTVEFTPSTACEGVAENSCGEPVFCLPKNVVLQITVKPPKVDPKNPPAGVFGSNGVTDMVGNSFDGNKNGTAEGPSGTVRIKAKDGSEEDFTLSSYGYNLFFNAPPADKSPFSDTAYWNYQVNNEVDLVAPVVTSIIPLSPPPADSSWGTVKKGEVDIGGPSQVPADLEVVVTWSKTMSPSSMVAGTTVYIMSKEWQKQEGSPVCVAGKTSLTQCPRSLVSQPAVVIKNDDPAPAGPEGNDITTTRIQHRPFFKANDLGWGEEEAKIVGATPIYLPVIRHRVKDDRQNCFYPSQGFECDDPTATTPDIPAGTGKPSCFNRTVDSSFYWKP